MHKSGVDRWVLKDQRRMKKVAIRREVRRATRPRKFKRGEQS